jgi:GntR family transcriptional regulator
MARAVISYQGQPGSSVLPIPMSYTQIAEDLEERIRSRKEPRQYPPGSKLPSYRELGELYSVSFTTVANVIRILRERGLVVGSPGRGVFVVDELPPPRPF